ncbi:uncharacterized protein LOC131022573 [Salvia miltiorrhiza]|uniref:uncharacterized protein LOC131022573 n=1 Tax=Salvia miltiorrhiza TaxID=226208 RepID=UPI0025AD6200|nr:uncharacterized protein LOC131022573 [Salvia miltiorrhiza]
MSLFSNVAFPRMPNLERLVLTYTGVQHVYNALPLTALLWAFPLLQEFKLEFANRVSYFETDIRNIKRSRHYCLKVFEVRGFCGDSGAHIELVKCISDNCLALQKIILDCRPIFPTTRASKVDLQMAKDYIKGKLQGKIYDDIKLFFVKYCCFICQFKPRFLS